MFELLTRLLLWMLLTYFIWYVLVKLVPQINVKWLVPIFLVVVVVMGLLFPNDQGIATAWNILSFPLKPIGLCIIFLINAAAQAKEKNAPKGLQNIIRSVLLILLLASIPWTSEKFEYSILRSNINHAQICPNNPNYTPQIRRETLIVMLANSVTEPGGSYAPEEQIFAMSDRLVQTAREYQNNLADLRAGGVLIASRTKSDSENTTKPSEFFLIQQELINLGVPRSDIYDLHNTFNTFNVKQTSEAIQKYINDRGISNSKIILIADAMDVGRVKLTIEKTLSENQPINLIANVIPSAWGLSTKLCKEQKIYPDLVDLIPNDSSWLRSSRFVDEFFTSSYYFLRNWLVPCWDCWDSVPKSSFSNPFES